MSNTLKIQKQEAYQSDEEKIRDALTATLKQVRESLHRSGSLSTRHEALDELSKLLFAHIMSIDMGGDGISKKLLKNGGPASALCEFVAECFKNHLSTSLAHELGPEDFRLKIKSTEDRLASELIDCFSKNAPASLFSQILKGGELDVLNDAFGQFLADSFIDEKELGQYLTPTEVVRFMVQIGLDLFSKNNPDYLTDSSSLILDPSCGVGSLLAEAMRQLYAQMRIKNHNELDKWTSEIISSRIVGIDKSERMIRLALTNLALFGASSVNLHLANSLVRAGKDAKISDALTGKVGLILTNPPFGAEFSGSDLTHYKIARLWAEKYPKKVDSEILFIERYIDWLAPNGLLVAVVPDSILTNRGLFANLRNGISKAVDVVAVVSLPKITFGVAGTTTKTSILVLRKRANNRQSKKTYFATCDNIGYDVTTRGAQRYKVSTGISDLNEIALEVMDAKKARIGHYVEFDNGQARWDATFHSKLSDDLQNHLRGNTKQLTIGDVAELSDCRIDPRRFDAETFDYIEISDIDSRTCSVWAKPVKCADAPSRARKQVKVGDLLISTVRPERRAMGVVPSSLNNAICSTGFAVLRCKSIDPHVLARLMQTDFVNAQILRNNMGVAYPTIDEKCLPNIVLPIDEGSLNELNTQAMQLDSMRQKLQIAEDEFRSRISAAILA